MSGHPYMPDVVILLVSLPLVAGLVWPNPRYGICTRRTLADQAHWYRINRLGGGLLSVACATGLLGLHFLPALHFPWDLAMAVGPILVACGLILLLDVVLWRRRSSDG